MRDDRAELKQPFKQIVAIVSDWNGTFLEDSHRALAATNVVMRGAGQQSLDFEQFRATFVLPLVRYFRELGIPDSDVDDAIAVWNREMLNGDLRLSRGTRELLERASVFGVPVGIVSAAAESVVRADAVRLGIADQLAFIEGDARDKVAAIQTIQIKLGGQILYIGDTEYDVESALAANAIAIGYGDGYRPAEALAELGSAGTVMSFHELNVLIWE